MPGVTPEFDKVVVVPPDVETSPDRLPLVTVPAPEKTVRFPAAGVPLGDTFAFAQSLSALKLPMTAVASATCPFEMELGTLHAASACTGIRSKPIARSKASKKSRISGKIFVLTFLIDERRMEAPLNAIRAIQAIPLQAVPATAEQTVALTKIPALMIIDINSAVNMLIDGFVLFPRLYMVLKQGRVRRASEFLQLSDIGALQ